LLVGGVLAGLFILWRGTRFWLFMGAWTLGITLAYSIIPYKTPWLMVSFLLPLTLVCGYAAEQLYGLFAPLTWRIVWVSILLCTLIACWRTAWIVNFDKYEDNSNSTGYFVDWGKQRNWTPYVDGQYGYVYAQTDRDFLEFVQAVKQAAAQFPTQNETGIHIASPEYWPLPWYLRDYPGVAYAGTLPAKLDEAPIAQPIVVARADQQAQLAGTPGWRQVGREYTLRPGVQLLVFVRDKQ
jgi:predicted membrane-bound mannosyltransferase